MSYDISKYSNRRFKNSEFDFSDRERPGQSPIFEDGKLQELLDKDSMRTQKELAAQLRVTRTAIFKRLHAMGKILQKVRRWVPHELTKHKLGQRISTCPSLLAKHQKKNFLWKILTRNEKYILFANLKRKTSWVDPGPPSIFIP